MTRWRELFVLLLWTSCCKVVSVEAEQRADFQRDSLLDKPLAELLDAPLESEATAFDTHLDIAFHKCRELGLNVFAQINSAQEELHESLDDVANVPDMVAYCNQLRYVRYVRQKYRALGRELAQQSKNEGTIEEEDTKRAIEIRSYLDVSFQEFVEKYAEQVQPVLLTTNSESDAMSKGSILGFSSEKELQRFLKACFDDETQLESAPLQYHDVQCAASMDQFRVPLYMVHDYIQRTNVSFSSIYLPRLVRAHNDVSSSSRRHDIVSCPHGLHMFVLPLSSVSMHVELFDKHFQPFDFSELGKNGIREVSVSADTWTSSVRKNIPVNSIFNADYFGQVASSHEPLLVPPRSLLFVPGSYFVTLRMTPSGLDDDRNALVFCFADATNIHAVRQQLSVDAIVNEDARTLLIALQSPSFDASMSRRPAAEDALWLNFIKWPKEIKLIKKSDLMESGSEQLQLSRRERLKQWQDDKRWDRYIESLTLPVSLPPVVVNVTRTTATLRWQDLYQPPKNDITPYGYNICWKQEDPPGDDEAVGVINVTHTQLVRSALPTTLFGDEFDGKDIELIVQGLQAETLYSFSVRMYLGDAVGLESDPSRSVRTTPCIEPSQIRGVPIATDFELTCLKLKWIPPEDDGGKPIVLYAVAMREVTDLSEALVEGGDFSETDDNEKVLAVNVSMVTNDGIRQTTRLCGLFPGMKYQFRIAALNSIGMSRWSARSDSIEMPSRISYLSRRSIGDKTTIPTIKGVGDPEYSFMRSLTQDEIRLSFTSNSQRILRDAFKPSVDSKATTKVLLSDVEEMLVVSDTDSGNALSFEVWSAHHSPRLFRVSSELVRADPLDASTPLRNAAQVKDRVVLVARGTVPFVFKAHHVQQAGAIGVIIADVNGTCKGTFDQQCVPGADKRRGEGFGMLDRHSLWLQNRIPCVLVLQDASERLLELVSDSKEVGQSAHTTETDKARRLQNEVLI